jgi:aromatase
LPRIRHSIEIRKSPGEVFEITNDIDNWKTLFNEYGHSEVIKREEAGRFTRLVFRLRNLEGNEWQSWRILDHNLLIAIAERDEPLFPFLYMHLKWSYEPVPNGTLMTWTQDFEIDPDLGVPEPEVVTRMDTHGRENQKRIKDLIETGQAKALRHDDDH